MNAPGLMTVVVLSGGLLATAPDKPASVEAENVIPMYLGESYLVEADRDVRSVQINPSTILSADFSNPRTITISGQAIGTAQIILLDDKRHKLFEAKIKVTPRLRGQE